MRQRRGLGVLVAPENLPAHERVTVFLGNPAYLEACPTTISFLDGRIAK